MAIIVDIDVMLARRKMPVGVLTERIGITPANLSVLKNGRAEALKPYGRFSQKGVVLCRSHQTSKIKRSVWSRD